MWRTLGRWLHAVETLILLLALALALAVKLIEEQHDTLERLRLQNESLQQQVVLLRIAQGKAERP